MYFNNTVPPIEYIAGRADGFYLVLKGHFVHLMFIICEKIGNIFKKQAMTK